MKHSKTRTAHITRAMAFAAVVVAIFLVGACTLGPDPERPVTAADASETYVYAAEQEMEGGADGTHQKLK